MIEKKKKKKRNDLINLSIWMMQLPNTLGFVFGIIQMVLYMIYRKPKTVALEEPMKVQELNGHIIDVVKLSTIMVPSDPSDHVAKGGAVTVTDVEDPNGKEETVKDNQKNMDAAGKV